MAKILVVEDDSALSEMIAKWLKDAHHVVDFVNSGADALQLLGCYSYDLLILDWGLPDMEGVNICSRFRREGGLSPVLFLTGRDDIDSKEHGLDSGADDYLTKPFEFPELMARVKALLRRQAGNPPQSISLQGLSLNTNTGMLSCGSRQIQLRAKEFQLLKFLMMHPNQAFNSKALLSAVWPADSAIAEQTVRSTMHSLRQKMDAAGKSGVIETIPSEGFVIRSEKS